MIVDRAIKIFNIKPVKYCILFGSLLVFTSFKASSQIIIDPVQNFNFGTFYQGNSGGTIDISPTGSRSATGDIILMNTGVSDSQAIFEIQAPAGSTISINSPDAILTGSNGGTLTLHIGNADLGSPFSTTVVPPSRTRLQIGGILKVGNRLNSPPGLYQGTFSITFHQE